MHCNAEFFYYVGKIRIGRPSKQRRVVLRRRNTVVGGKCALPSALLVRPILLCHMTIGLIRIMASGYTCRCCSAGAVVYGARGATRIVDSCSPSVSCWTTTSSFRRPTVTASRVSTSATASSSSSSSRGACWCITVASRTSVTRRSRCAATTSPPDSRNARVCDHDKPQFFYPSGRSVEQGFVRFC